MTTHDFSIKNLALSLIEHLDRQNIFPPMLNNPEAFLSPINKLTNLPSRHPKRSPNTFLICRKNVQEEAKRKRTFNMRVISKATGLLWNDASPEEKNVYKKLAAQVSEIHHKRTSIYKKISTSSLEERPLYKPYNSFRVQLRTKEPLANPPSYSSPSQKR